jgi:hypothetical protein
VEVCKRALVKTAHKSHAVIVRDSLLRKCQSPRSKHQLSTVHGSLCKIHESAHAFWLLDVYRTSQVFIRHTSQLAPPLSSLASGVDLIEINARRVLISAPPDLSNPMFRILNYQHRQRSLLQPWHEDLRLHNDGPDPSQSRVGYDLADPRQSVRDFE